MGSLQILWCLLILTYFYLHCEFDLFRFRIYFLFNNVKNLFFKLVIYWGQKLTIFVSPKSKLKILFLGILKHTSKKNIISLNFLRARHHTPGPSSKKLRFIPCKNPTILILVHRIILFQNVGNFLNLCKKFLSYFFRWLLVKHVPCVIIRYISSENI